jgi:hypothetical protein
MPEEDDHLPPEQTRLRILRYNFFQAKLGRVKLLTLALLRLGLHVREAFTSFCG